MGNEVIKQTRISLSEIRPNTELFLALIFLYSETKYRKIRTGNNSAFGHFSRSFWGKVLMGQVKFVEDSL